MRAIIYTRVSNDAAGRSRSTQDQEQECRAYCDTQGWPVAEVLCDQDIGASRWSGKQRPAYLKLQETLQPGDVLVTWEASRAQRDLSAYVQLRELCASKGILWCYSGRLYDLRDGDDRFTTGLDALLSEKESEQTRTRVRRGMRAAAAAGKPHGRAPFGYQPKRDERTGKAITWIPDPGEASIVQTMAQRVLAGESIAAVTKDLTDRAIPAPGYNGATVKPWSRVQVRNMLASPTYAGLRVHKGETSEGNWEPLISEDDHRILVGLLSDPARLTHRGTGPRHLLTGIAKCGVCGGPVRWVSATPRAKSPAYACERKCVRRRAELVDELVVQVVLLRLERVDPAGFDVQSVGAAEALAEAKDLRARLDGFTDQAADGGLSPSALARIEGKLLPQIAAAERKASMSMNPLVGQIVGRAARERWELMPLIDRRQLIDGCVTVAILKSSVGTRRFTPDDVRIEWKI